MSAGGIIETAIILIALGGLTVWFILILADAQTFARESEAWGDVPFVCEEMRTGNRERRGEGRAVSSPSRNSDGIARHRDGSVTP